MQFSPPVNGIESRRTFARILRSKVYMQSDVDFELPFEAFANLPAGDELAYAPGKRRDIHKELERDRRLVDRDRWQCRSPVGIRDRLSDIYIGDAGNDRNIA